MLGGPREAHDPPDERVVATVRPPVGSAEQLIEAMRRTLPPTIGHLETKSPKTRGGHRDKQPRLALATLGEIGEPGGHELVAREIIRNAAHHDPS